MNENMKIYEASRTVQQEALKQIQAGRLKGMSDINPMWRIKKLTELFGMCGVGWKITITDKRLEQGSEEQIVCFVDIELSVKVDGQWSEPIIGMGGSSFIAKESRGLYTSDECFKMAYTDAISVACKSLGFAADVYFEKDRTKYSGNGEAAAGEPKQDIPPASLKAKYELFKGDMGGFDEWVKTQQEKKRNFKQMEQILTDAIKNKTKESA